MHNWRNVVTNIVEKTFLGFNGEGKKVERKDCASKMVRARKKYYPRGYGKKNTLHLSIVLCARHRILLKVFQAKVA